MIKLEAKENFTLRNWGALKNIKRATSYDKDGMLMKGDTFETDEETARYLTNETPNPVNRAVATIVEIIKEAVKEEAKKEENASYKIEEAEVQVKEAEKPKKKPVRKKK